MMIAYRLIPLLALSAAACSTAIQTNPMSDGGGLADSGLTTRADARPGQDPIDAGSQLEGVAVVLAPASNADAREVGLLAAADGLRLEPFIKYDDFPALAGGSPQAASQNPDTGDIYVVDPVLDSIHIFSPDGQLVVTRVINGLLDTEAPRSVAFWGDEVWYSTNKGRVGAISATGKALTDKLQLPPDQRLEYLLILDDGRFMVSNATSDQVQLFENDGAKVSDVYAINSPEQIYALGGDEFAVVGYVADALATFKLDGTELSRIDGLNGPQGVARLDNGNFAATIRTNGVACDVGSECLIQEFSTTATPVGTLSDGPLVRRLERAILPVVSN
jgi:hypothetical protein